MSSVVYVFLGCVHILPTNSIPNPVIVSFLITPSLDYSLTQNAFLCFDPTLKNIFVSCHVKFVENVFLFASFSISTTLVINTTSALLASSFLSCDYPTPPSHTIELTQTAPFITNTLPVLSLSCFSPTGIPLNKKKKSKIRRLKCKFSKLEEAFNKK